MLTPFFDLPPLLAAKLKYPDQSWSVHAFQVISFERNPFVLVVFALQRRRCQKALMEPPPCPALAPEGILSAFRRIVQTEARPLAVQSLTAQLTKLLPK